MIWTIPNILTIARLLAAPGIAVMFLYFDRPYADWFALLLFLIASESNLIGNVSQPQFAKRLFTSLASGTCEEFTM